MGRDIRTDNYIHSWRVRIIDIYHAVLLRGVHRSSRNLCIVFCVFGLIIYDKK